MSHKQIVESLTVVYHPATMAEDYIVKFSIPNSIRAQVSIQQDWLDYLGKEGIATQIARVISDIVFSQVLEDLAWFLNETPENHNFHTGGIIEKQGIKEFDNANSLSGLAKKLKDIIPGIMELAECPDDDCTESREIYGLIMHVNDSHKWTREQIADWLEALDIDLSFQVKEDQDAKD